MQRHNRRWQRGSFLFLLLITPSALAQDTPSPEQISVTPSPTADERLFLLRVLEGLYESWPVDLSDPDLFVATATELRRTALKLGNHAADSSVDPELVRLFADYVAALDAYVEFLASIEGIEQEAARQMSEDEFEAGFEGGVAGGSTFAGMRNSDYSTAESAGAALIVGLVTYLYDSWSKAEARDEATQAAGATEARRVSDSIDSALLRAQNAAQTLTARHGWERGEAGFELSEAQAQRALEMFEAGNVDGLLRMAEHHVDNRPRDPFVRLTRNWLASSAEDVTAASHLRNARDCVETASLVPAPAVYNEFRTQCLGTAATLASVARETEILNGAGIADDTESARYSVVLWREMLEREPADPTGEIREMLAFSLMSSNELRNSTLLMTDIADLREESPDFWYQFSCLTSHLGDFDGSLLFLDQAIRTGYLDISYMKSDPHLGRLRGERAAEFDDRVKVRWAWDIVYGVFNDDIRCRNNSRFPLTNVVLDVKLEQDSRVWNEELFADVIMPGETYTWSNVVSIPGSRLTDSTVLISCDQNR